MLLKIMNEQNNRILEGLKIQIAWLWKSFQISIELQKYYLEKSNFWCKQSAQKVI